MEMDINGVNNIVFMGWEYTRCDAIFCNWPLNAVQLMTGQNQTTQCQQNERKKFKKILNALDKHLGVYTTCIMFFKKWAGGHTVQ